jgi:hypothetical protein
MNIDAPLLIFQPLVERNSQWISTAETSPPARACHCYRAEMEREAEGRLGVCGRLAAAMPDRRDPQPRLA